MLIFYLLAIGSGIITSIWVIFDAMGNYHIKNPYLFGAYEMTVGLIASIILVLLLHIPLPSKGKIRLNLGYYFDPNFQYLHLPLGKQGLFTLLAGLFATGNTVVYFILLERFDASIIMPFSQFVLIYLLVADSISEKEKPVMIEIQSILMIAIGVIIATLSKGNIDVNGILLIIGPFSIFSALYIYFQKRALTIKDAKGRKLDTVNLRIWTLLIMTIGQVLASLPTILKKGITEITENWKPALAPSLLSMLLVYVSVVFYTRALTMGKMSIVKALNSISVVATIPFAALAAIWMPEVFNTEFTGSFDIILKISGSILILLGMIALALSETKSILLAKLKQGEAIDLEKLTKLKGVAEVAFITGEYDLLIRVRIRSIGRTYRLLEKSIAKLPWIADIMTLQIMKEYE